MSWLDDVRSLRERREPGVLVTVVAVRGHAPRDAGAKMLVTANHVRGSVGGGNLEETAVVRARALIAEGGSEPETADFRLNEHAPVEHGTQCCGGEVSLLLEPLLPVPAVAIFGAGHVGLELARILTRHDIDLHLVDSRARELDEGRLSPLQDAIGTLHVHHAPVPELVLGQIARGTHVLIMSHDHAEDIALCDAALRCGHLGSIGLIGSTAKWRRFEQKLAAEGHDAEAIGRISCPIGLPGIEGKEPAVIAVAVAAHLLMRFQTEAAARPVRTATA